jgi:hypothetical protein
MERPDERRDFSKGHIDVVDLDGLAFGVETFEPGWRWSDSVKPIVGTDLCEVYHNGYVASGRMRVRMADGTETDLNPGDAYVVPPGHDAWVLGDEPCVAYDFSGRAAGYATKGEEATSRKVADCRDMPSEMGCTLTIAGREDEVVDAAVDHAVTTHGHEKTPELREQVRSTLKDEASSRV